jgi:hypothetical protein
VNAEDLKRGLDMEFKIGTVPECLQAMARHEVAFLGLVFRDILASQLLTRLVYMITKRNGKKKRVCVPRAHLHEVHTAVLAPATERLAFPPEHDAEGAPKKYKCGIRHDRWNKTVRL